MVGEAAMSRVYDREKAAEWEDMVGEHCIVCGGPRQSVHHIPPIGTGRRAAWVGALLGLCGSGTTGCHGLWHHGELELRFACGGWMWRGVNAKGRRERDWVPCHGDEFWEVMGC